MTPTKSEWGGDTAVQVTVCCAARALLTAPWPLQVRVLADAGVQLEREEQGQQGI